MVHRTDSNYPETVRAVVSGLINLYVMDDKMMKQVRQGASNTSKAASWENFIVHYDKAYEQALSRAQSRTENN